MAGETILVVEDNLLNLELVSDILEAHGYRVLKATSGARALEQIQAVLPALILMDIQLPELDGLTMAGILKDDPRTQHIPIVALTAHAMQGDREKAHQAGCNGYITKPIDTRKLTSTVRSFLDGSP